MKEILELSSHGINKYLSGEKNLSIEEQGHIIQQKINEVITKVE